MTAPRVLRAIVGPTAAGKSALALAVAERVGAAVVSADSRQLYRDFDVGTAKATPPERARAPHFGIDVAEPVERWSAARWADECAGWVAECDAREFAPLVVGGTGLYLRALADPIFAEPALDAGRRAALARVLHALATEELRRWVRALDPARAHLQRTQLLRAVEVALLTGERISALHARCARPACFAVHYLVVDPGAVLAERIERRVDQMLAGGWLDEVRVLADRVPPDAPAWRSTGYDTWRAYLDGGLAFGEARARVVIATRQYSKRQRTWFRHQLAGAPVLRLDPDAPGALDRALAWWRDEAGAPPRVAPPTTPDEDAA